MSLAPPRGGWPRISIVTPVRNSVRFLESAMRSVLDQGYPDLEYVVIDGASTDGSLEVVKRFETQLASWTSEPDAGMYSALNKGFARCSGEVLGWLSATDVLHRGSLFAIGSAFASLPRLRWLTGIPTGLSEDGMVTSVGPQRLWSRGRFLLGDNRYIQQESTFWRRSLWEAAGARLDTERELFGDFELWLRFFRHAELHPLRALVGGFRHHLDSGWLSDRERARRMTEELVERELAQLTSPLLRALATLGVRVRRSRSGRWLWDRLVSKPLSILPGPDRPRLVWHDGRSWQM